MKDVFISYKTEEFDEANWVKTTLETNGISCWMAPMCIPGGSSYAAEIPKAIRECKVFVLILSEKTQRSKWVPRELDQAINEGKTVLPFMLENCPLKDDFNFYLTNVQRYAAYESKSVAIQKMLSEIRAILGIKETPKPRQSTEPVQQNIGNAPVTTYSLQETFGAFFGGNEAQQNTRPVQQPARTAVNNPPSKKAKISYKPLIVLGVIVGLFFAVLLGIAMFENAEAERNTIVIAGEEFSINDTYLYLEDKNLTEGDVENLKKMENLSSLYLTSCQLPTTDLGPFCNRLDGVLSLIDCGITAIHLESIDFENMELWTLELDSNENLTDLSAIAPLYDNLMNLSFNDCNVTDLSFLEGFTELYNLSAWANGITDISVFAGLPQMEVLCLMDNEITSLSALSACTGLTHLEVSFNLLTDLSGLETCIYLENLSACYNGITDISGIANATLLNDVDLSNNQISDVSVLAKSAATLVTLDIGDNQLTDISCLSGCTQMQDLRISYNTISDLGALSGMTELRSLSAVDVQLADIQGIANCNKLIYIDLSDNRITSTQAIFALGEDPSGVVLDLSNNNLTSVILPQVKYNYLALYGNDLGNLSSLNGTSGATMVVDYHADIDFSGLSQSDYYEYYVFDCPLDQQVSVEEYLGTYRVHFSTEQEFIDSMQEQ